MVNGKLAFPSSGTDPMPRPLTDTLAKDPTYLTQAEACLTAAAATVDLTARALHQEECRLWLMLASQRRAIEAVVRRHGVDPAGP